MDYRGQVVVLAGVPKCIWRIARLGQIRLVGWADWRFLCLGLLARFRH